ncbi:MAG: ATP-grasp fold amidoligase family protein [Clostridia bacterium]
MERDSFIYKTRRKIQVVAHKLFSNEFMSKLYFKIVLKEKLDLKNPRTFNEKLQWLKLYYYPQNDLAVKCADKYKVREYIKDKGYENTLVPLLGAWDNVEDIDWDSLPNKFVLKCNHGCAYNIVCSDKTEFDRIKAKKQLNTWLKEDFGAFNIEPHYSNIKKHKITCEKFLGDNLVDYKFFCFNGIPKFIYVSSDLIHDRQARIGFFNIDGSKINLKRDDYASIEKIKLLSFYNEMLKMASKLCKDFPFVRVDFFVTKNKYYFAELTFTPSACMMPFNPKEMDLEWGEMLNIKNLT